MTFSTAKLPTFHILISKCLNYFTVHFPGQKIFLCGFSTTLQRCNKFPTYLWLGMTLFKFPTISQIPNPHGNPENPENSLAEVGGTDGGMWSLPVITPHQMPVAQHMPGLKGHTTRKGHTSVLSVCVLVCTLCTSLYQSGSPGFFVFLKLVLSLFESVTQEKHVS